MVYEYYRLDDGEDQDIRSLQLNIINLIVIIVIIIIVIIISTKQ